MKYPIDLFKGHPIISDGDHRILIDTGSPTTIHTESNLVFGSKSYACSSNYMGLTASSISEMLGTDITTLLGVDIQSDYIMLIDYQSKSIEFSTELFDMDGIEVDISRFMGLPIIHMRIQNQVMRFFLDTGAKLSYVSEDVTAHVESMGIEQDFYPGIGTFETECFLIPTILGDSEILVKYGHLPALLQMKMTLANADGIIGYDLFSRFKVMLDLENETLRYSEYS